MDICLEEKEEYKALTWEIPLVEGKMHVIYPNARKAITRYMQEEFGYDYEEEEIREGQTFEIIKDGIFHYVISLDIEPDHPRFTRIMIHEAVHIADYIIDTLDLGTDEIRAILVEHITSIINKEIGDKVSDGKN